MSSMTLVEAIDLVLVCLEQPEACPVTGLPNAEAVKLMAQWLREGLANG